jgi:DNA-binding winged helix-turn-helix (wHTH) protein
VTHDELVQAVWGQVAMSESLLRTHIRELRRNIGEGIVETVVGRGYRFVPRCRRCDPRPRTSLAHRNPRSSAAPMR